MQELQNYLSLKCFVNKLTQLKNKLTQQNQQWIITGGIIVFGSYYILKQVFRDKIETKIEAQQKYQLNQKPKRIILIRHGQTQANIQEDIYAYIPNHLIELNQTGIEQALEAGYKLKQIVKDETIRFYVSPFKRTKQTLVQILKSFENKEQFNMQEDPRIREQEFGNLEKYQLSQKQRQEVKQERKLVGKFFYRYTNGESGADVYNRCTMFLDTLLRRIYNLSKRKYDNYAIVTHGLLMQLFIMRYFKLTIEQFEQLNNPKNCEIQILIKNEQGNYELQANNLNE